MKIRPFLLSSVIIALLTILIFVFEFAVSDVFGGALTIVGMFLSPLWLIFCGIIGGVVYRLLAHELPIKTGIILGGLGGFLGVFLPVFAFILEMLFSNINDLSYGVSGLIYMSQYGVVFFWVPFVWIIFSALGAMLIALILKLWKRVSKSNQ